MTTSEREKRWLVIAEDGRHVTLGRHTDPTEEEIAVSGERLDEMNLAGWLVVSEGGYYRRHNVSLLLVRPITKKTADWVEAQSRWQAIRENKLASLR